MKDLQAILDMFPMRPPAIFCEQLLELEPGVRGVGIKNVTINEPYFQGMDPEDLVMPRGWLTESIGQVGILTLLSHESNHGKRGMLIGINHFEYHVPVRPGDRLWMEFRITNMKGNFGKGMGYAKVNDQIVAEGELLYSWS